MTLRPLATVALAALSATAGADNAAAADDATLETVRAAVATPDPENADGVTRTAADATDRRETSSAPSRTPRPTPLEPSPPTRCRPNFKVDPDDLPAIPDPLLAVARRHTREDGSLPRRDPVETAVAEERGLLVELAPDPIEPRPETASTDPVPEDPESSEGDPVASDESPADVNPVPEPTAEPAAEPAVPPAVADVAAPPRRLPTGDEPLPLADDDDADRELADTPDDDREDRAGEADEPAVAASEPRQDAPTDGDREADAATEPDADAERELTATAEPEPPAPEVLPEAVPAVRLSDGYVVDPDDPLAAQVADAIDVTGRRVLSTGEHTPWQIAHGLLALRERYVVNVDGRTRDALTWIATNPTHDGTRWFQRTRYGARPQPFTVPYAFEGHPNQFLAFMTMAELPEDYSVVIDRRRVPFQHFVKNAQATVKEGEETSWTLWLLANSIDTDQRWYASDRSVWDFPKLLRKEMSEPVTKKACGGNHGLFAIAAARNARVKSGKSFHGVWRQAHQHLAQHAALAKRLQNSDGSLSSNYYKGRESTDDPSKRVSTSGHTLEFLVTAAAQDDLKQPWLRKAVGVVAGDLVRFQEEPLEVGGMYHALHALVIYRERTFEAVPEPTEPPRNPAAVAETPADTRIR